MVRGSSPRGPTITETALSRIDRRQYLPATPFASDREPTPPEREAPAVGGNRFELKYVFNACHAPSIVDWAGHCLVPDEKFPVGKVSSIYFDDAAMESYQGKRNSDFLKSKLRLRWYGPLADGSDGIHRECFLEMKAKTGPLGSKARVRVDIDPGILASPFEQASALRSRLSKAAAELQGSGMLASPAILIEYLRRRYVDPDSRSRVAIDTSIHAIGNARASWVSAAEASLDSGVLEIKGTERALPRCLTPVASLLFRESFSKYARCCESLALPVARRT